MLMYFYLSSSFFGTIHKKEWLFHDCPPTTNHNCFVSFIQIFIDSYATRPTHV